MAKGIQQGWPIVLSSLKSLLETGQGIDVFAKPKRRPDPKEPFHDPALHRRMRVRRDPLRRRPHAPVFQNHCQCRDCQQRSGTGHGSYLTFPARAEMAITGEATRLGGRGRQRQREGPRLLPGLRNAGLPAFPAMPDLIAVHAASLDEPGRFAPQVTYGVRAWRGTPSIPRCSHSSGCRPAEHRAGSQRKANHLDHLRRRLRHRPGEDRGVRALRPALDGAGRTQRRRRTTATSCRPKARATGRSPSSASRAWRRYEQYRDALRRRPRVRRRRPHPRRERLRRALRPQLHAPAAAGSIPRQRWMNPTGPVETRRKSAA